MKIHMSKYLLLITLALVFNILFCSGQNGQWENRISTFPVYFVGHSSGEFDGKIFITGGYHRWHQDLFLSFVYPDLLCYDINNNQWNQIPESLPLARGYSASIVANENMYIMGGFGDARNAGGPYKEINIYNFKREQWIMVDFLPSKRHRFMAVEKDNNIYTIGGSTTYETIIDSVAKYDIKSRFWSTMEPLPLPLAYGSAVCINNDIFVIGGMNSYWEEPESVIFKYNITENTWDSNLTDIPGRLSRLAACEYNGFIYVFGGQSTRFRSFKKHIVSSAVYMYDPKTDYWQTISKMPEGLYGMDIHEVDGKIFLVGGLNATDKQSFDWASKKPGITTYKPVEAPVYAISTNLSKYSLDQKDDSSLFTAEIINHYDYIPTIIARRTGQISGEIIDTELYDDGKHGDGLESDGYYSNYLNHPGIEDLFHISIISYNPELSEQFISGLYTRPLCTIGPVNISQYHISEMREIAGQGTLVTFTIELKNRGLRTSASDLSANLFSSDNYLTVIDRQSTCKDLIPNQIAKCDSQFKVLISKDSPPSKSFMIHVSISSDGLSYWNEQLEIVISK